MYNIKANVRGAYIIAAAIGARALTYGGNRMRRAKDDIASLPSIVIDAIIVSLFCVILFTFEYIYDLAPILFQFALEYREWKIDNIIFVSFVMSIGFAIFSFGLCRPGSAEAHCSNRRRTDLLDRSALF